MWGDRTWRPVAARILLLVGGAVGCQPAAIARGTITPDETPAPPADALADSQVEETPTTTAVDSRLFNVLFITIDSLRADMPWAGYPRDIAPRLTDLAKRCTVYTRAYATASHTAPSLGSILYGRYASELERDGYFSAIYPETQRSFVTLLAEAGVRSASGHAHEYLRRAGFHRGFDTYQVLPGLVPGPNLDKNLTSASLERLAQQQIDGFGNLESEGQEPSRFFAWYHFVDPHAEWLTAPKEEGVPNFGAKTRDRYDGEVYYTDKYVGRLIDLVASKPYAARTVVIVTSDHGEGLGDHGQMYHGYETWESLVRVPLLVCVPGAEPRYIDTPRSLVDLGPTILELLGVPVPEGFRGASLLPEVNGEASSARDVLVDLPANDLSFSRRALIGARYKMVAIGESHRRVLYDLENDPRELVPIRSGPLFNEQSQRLTDMEATLREVRPSACAKRCAKGWD
jgi:choline-sulfatase